VHSLGIGVPELFIIAFLVVPVVPLLLFAWGVNRRRRQFGYPSAGAYLRAVPRSDPERRDAVDLALKGLACCVLGLLFSPFVLVGLVPLFYGGRKLAYASMGLGLVDDADEPSV
jgi:hypothetical protein